MLAVAERVHALFGAGLLFIATGAAERCVETMLVEGLFQAFGFHDVGVLGAAVGERVDVLRHAIGVDMGDEVRAQFFDHLVAELVHFWNFQRVSTCITGNGSLPGKNALRAVCSITAESLPMEYSITGLSNSAATSRMMWMLSASSCFRCVSLSTMATHESFLMNGQRAVFERGILAQRPLLIRTPTRTKGHMNMPASSADEPL